MENIIQKDNLVVLKGKAKLISSKSGLTFEPNKHYRCISAFNNDDSQHLVYGVVFDDETFKEYFEYLHDRMIREWNENGLIVNNKKLSKKGFVEVLDIHVYGKGQNKLFIAFVGNKMNGIWGFYSAFRGDTKVKFLNDAYGMYLDLLNGDMSSIDNDYVQRGDSGIPISYGDIRFRPEWNPNNEKNEIYF